MDFNPVPCSPPHLHSLLSPRPLRHDFITLTPKQLMRTSNNYILSQSLTRQPDVTLRNKLRAHCFRSSDRPETRHTPHTGTTSLFSFRLPRGGVVHVEQ
ncbi:hypothetical protein E2C01_019940 [Portunus trituberculatus]|uniref:Uncharacterized protein n=1 Tax=Portunus trituberculatus TaxID=210409 RepID=A0A5B7DYX8_PORTR|nr:hypothetical protein [Portunus trituberculatus]